MTTKAEGGAWPKLVPHLSKFVEESLVNKDDEESARIKDELFTLRRVAGAARESCENYGHLPGAECPLCVALNNLDRISGRLPLRPHRARRKS